MIHTANVVQETVNCLTSERRGNLDFFHTKAYCSPNDLTVAGCFTEDLKHHCFGRVYYIESIKRSSMSSKAQALYEPMSPHLGYMTTLQITVILGVLYRD